MLLSSNSASPVMSVQKSNDAHIYHVKIALVQVKPMTFQ